MKKIYLAKFRTSNGTYNKVPFEYSNKRKAISSIREIARGNCTAGETAVYQITDSKYNEVYFGKIK